MNAAIAYNIWQYFQATGDLEFLRFYGAEMILEIARFWASIATYNHALDRYEIKGVMGPDEYHEGYPDRDEPGLDNNAYTNVMAVWCLCRAFDVLDALPPSAVRELRERLAITDQELDRWDDISRKMRVCFHDGVISQFEGYELLEELDWEAYRQQYGDIQRLDRILEAEGDSPNRYKLTKQADVMMLFYLLSADELAELLERLGYDYDDELIPRIIDYYEPRTVARLDAQPRGPRLDPCPPRPGPVVASVPPGPVQRRRRRRRAARPGRASTSAPWPARSTSCSAATRASSCATTCCACTPSLPDELGSLAFGIRYRGHLVHLEFTPELAAGSRGSLTRASRSPSTSPARSTPFDRARRSRCRSPIPTTTCRDHHRRSRTLESRRDESAGQLRGR